MLLNINKLCYIFHGYSHILCVCVFCSNIGGGLISGVTLAAKALNPSIRVLAAEPKGADDAARSKAEGRIITLPETDTIADGLRAFLGELTWYAL